MTPDAITAQLARIEAMVADTNGRVRETDKRDSMRVGCP